MGCCYSKPIAKITYKDTVLFLTSEELNKIVTVKHMLELLKIDKIKWKRIEVNEILRGVTIINQVYTFSRFELTDYTLISPADLCHHVSVRAM
jgi:hypothetical protein